VFTFTDGVALDTCESASS